MSSLSKSPSPGDEDDVELRRGPWTREEDTLLIRYIASHGEGRWNLLAKSSGLRRTGKSCRLRWLNYLKPDVKRGNLTPQEQLLILQLHSKWGNRWSKIAQHLPGRTDNEIKNYWRTRVQKQARHLKIDSNSMAFQDLIRTCWMPRLLQKIEMLSPPSSHNIANNHHPLEYHSSLPEPVLPPQVLSHPREPLNDIDERMLCSLDHHDKSSCSSTSSEYQTSSFHGIGNSGDYNTTLNDFNYVNNNGYDMESLNLASVSTSGDYGNPAGDLHNWVDDDFTDSLWNTDELWQFREF